MKQQISIKHGKEKEFEDAVALHSTSSFDLRILNFALLWASLMERQLNKSIALSNGVIRACELKADKKYSMSGASFMYAQGFLEEYWAYARVLDDYRCPPSCTSLE